MDKIKVIKREDDLFPWFLANMEDGPEQLYCLGNTELLKMPKIAVVGARKCSSYGKQAAMGLGKILAENDIVTVSGMARGIDSFAHMGALDNEGKTIAVLGCGVDVCYPPNNKSLYENIKNKGLVISEYPPGTVAQPYMFPLRNRIISGISTAVAVVEAGLKSGSLITAVNAATQGKEVFALPGNINSGFSVGTNKLIQDGATILTDLSEILSCFPELEKRSHGQQNKSNLKLGEDELAIYSKVQEMGAATCDELCFTLGKTPAFITGILTIMEIKGYISYENGKIYIAKV